MIRCLYFRLNVSESISVYEILLCLNQKKGLLTEGCDKNIQEHTTNSDIDLL